MKRFFVLFAVLALSLHLTGCGYNKIQTLDENVDMAKSKMISAGKRRADTIDNLVETVKGYAGHEKSTLEEVTKARASVGSVNIDGKDPKAMDQYLKSQDQLSGALSRLMVVSENYPQLKADAHFSQLMMDLKAADRSMQHARDSYIQSIAAYNKYIRKFPVNMTASVFGYEKKPQYEVADLKSVESAPKVKF